MIKVSNIVRKYTYIVRKKRRKLEVQQGKKKCEGDYLVTREIT